MNKIILIILLLILPAVYSPAQKRMTMEECMRYAVIHSFESQRANTDLQNYRERYTNAIANHFPYLSSSLGTNNNYGRGIDPATNSYINTSTFNNNMGLNLSLPIFKGFQLLNKTRSAKIAKLKGEEELRRVSDEVAENTMAAFAEAIYNTELVSLSEQRLERYKTEKQRAARMCELGTGSIADLTQLEATIASEEYTLISYRNTLEISIIKLKDCMNFPLEDTLIIEPEIRHQEILMPEQLSDEIMDYAQSHLSQSKIDNYTLQSSLLDLKIARSQFYPTLNFGAGISSSYYTRLDKGAVHYAPYGKQLRNNIGKQLQVSLSIPILNGLNSRSSVRIAKNNYEQAQRDYDESIRKLSSEITQAVLEVNAARSQWIQAQKNVTAQETAHKINQRKYEEGLLSIIDLQTSDNQLFSAQIELRNSYLRYQIKVREINYYKGIPYIQ